MVFCALLWSPLGLEGGGGGGGTGEPHRWLAHVDFEMHFPSMLRERLETRLVRATSSNLVY